MSARPKFRDAVNDDRVSTPEEAARALGFKFKRNPDGSVQTNCPAHDDKSPSLSISTSDTGTLLFHCHAGCSQEAVADHLRRRKVTISPPKREKREQPAYWRPVATYDYQNEHGETVFRKRREHAFSKGGKQTGEKRFCQLRPNAKGGWTPGLGGLDTFPPYRLPELIAKPTDEVHIAEGEKDADTLAALGLVSTSFANVKKTDLTHLRGRSLVIHGDNDPAGQKHVDELVSVLGDAAAQMRAVFYRDAGPKADVTDWVSQGQRTLEDLLEYIEANAFDPLGAPTSKPEIPENPTEDSIALAFAERHIRDLRYDHTAETWMVFNGSVWVPDKTKRAFNWAREIARLSNAKGLPSLSKAATASGIEKFARSDQRLATTSEHWDRHLWLLATPGGTIDLRTGDLLPSDREHHLTKSTEVAPAPPGTPATVWTSFLDAATGGDHDLAAFLQRVAGYCLTGVTSEHALFFLYGDGGNGKGVYLNTLTAILKDHARVAPMDTFASVKNQRHESELASLHGARFVTAQETEQGRAWNDARIKALTGGDPISACFKHKDYFTFVPQFKLVIAGNHKPQIKAIDAAMRRRFNIIPFTHKPDKPDHQLSEKLKAEWPAILRWAIDGCLAWQRQGLNPPEVVASATSEYFDEQDVLSQWIADCIDLGEHKEDTAENLRRSWCAWANAAGEPEGSTRTFSEMLKRGGFTPQKHTRGAHGKRGFKGLSVRPKDTSDQWSNQHDR